MRTAFIPLLALLVIAPTVAADQAKIDAAVAKAAEFFKKRAAQPLTVQTSTHGNGEIALMGLAMLEAGVPPADASLKNVIKVVRDSALEQTATYPVSLSVLFLDRLGDPADVPMIQMLGLRLYAGMTASGGWGYNTWEAGTNVNELVRLRKAFEERELVNDPKAQPGGKSTPKLHPEVEKYATAVIQTLRARGRAGQGDDNSNTQFGMIALWVACRNGLPCKDAFALVERRFLASQNPQDGGWGYHTGGIGMGNSTPAMTAAGLLGLALGAGARDASLTAEKKVPAKPAAPSEKPKDNDPFSNPNDPNRPKTAPKDDAKNDGGSPANLPRTVRAALTTFGQFLQATHPARVRGNAGPGQALGALGTFVGAGNSYYLLWSMERMALAYSLDTIGGVDWHAYGVTLLLPAQQADGSWNDVHYGPEVNTAFAVLFLTKSNLVRDLTSKVKGTKDPGNTELRGSNAPALLAPPPKEPVKGGNGKVEPAPPRPPAPSGSGFILPAVVMPTEAAEAVKIATALLEAKDDWPRKLEQARDAKGSKWSRGLALVCAKAEGENRKQAREALAERLTRMTTATLKTMLADDDTELRRAACLAAAMKEDKSLIPAVIDRVTDAAEPVVRAARAALKSLSGADFGPAPGADDEARIAAAKSWLAWYESQKK